MGTIFIKPHFGYRESQPLILLYQDRRSFMQPVAGYTSRHTPPVRSARRGDNRTSCTAQHTSRREIDMAIGAYMALRRCSEDQARAALICATQSARLGLGAASQALLAWVNDTDLDAEADRGLTYWRTHFASPRSPASGS
ncbi:ANTAR domain-containing protein [Mycobacterium sp. SMC-4]|uniref:ANTAR domain-containing protein n=1 Tax=Mycobacterium sp. SMC-4 TaxID=2857059 RepID=UPI0021B32EEF|nr:ANTAR domain-containing protein [Mycobacterium sp. SMC-4]UXA16766.1 ANTAR domain-containing protein [Mycobacterium sp. SMC-4]